MKNRSFILLFCFFSLVAHSEKRFEWTPLMQQAYQKTIQLRFVEANTLIARIKLSDPENLLVYHVENYMDFFRVYIDEDEAEFDRLEKNRDRRLEKIKEGDQNSPYYLYLQADIRLQWALGRLKFEEFTTAFFEVNKAFKLLNRNVKKFPDFMPNKKDLGILHAMVGTIPDGYQWAIRWFSSLSGTIAQGTKELREVVHYSRQHDFIYEEEIYVLYAYLMLHLGNDKKEAWSIINTSNLRPETNPMDCFIVANVAMRTGRGETAIRILENRPAGSAFFPFPYLDYMLGLSKLERLDKDADIYLHRFLDSFSGRNFIKDAYQKLAWHSLLQSDQRGYEHFIGFCQSKGYAIVGSDKSALQEAKSNRVPNVLLLKARLLFDGGYFEKAYSLLELKMADDFAAKKDQLEFNYRIARIAQQMKNYPQALYYYQKTIDDGKREGWYYACRAALEQGHIYECQQQKQQAKAAFNRCLAIKPSQYKTGLHQQAKAGLVRLGN